MLWFFRKSRPAKTVQDDLVSGPPNILHSHDLAFWHYLGYTRCRYVDDKGVTTSTHFAFLFVDKHDDKKRSYRAGDPKVKRHSYFDHTVLPWVAGEGEVYSIINGNPSDYLKGYMLENFRCDWDRSTNWWVSTSNAKYSAAASKQKKKEPATGSRPVAVTDGNVISLDFKQESGVKDD